MSSAIEEYRKHCVTAEQKAQEDFDKSVLSLSGGALGISFAFIKDIVGAGALMHPKLLLGSWLAWGGSIVAILASFFFSQLALRTAITQVDEGTIGDQLPGKGFARATLTLNAVGGVLFLLGVVLIVAFVSYNMGGIHGPQAKPPG